MEKELFELNFIILSRPLQRLFCRLKSLVSVVAVVSESDVGVEGICRLKELVDSRLLLLIVAEDVGERPVPIVRMMKSAGFSPTESSSGTCSKPLR